MPYCGTANGNGEVRFPAPVLQVIKLGPSEDEKKAVEILVASGVAAGRNIGIRAVVDAMPKSLGSTSEAEKIVNRLMMRGLVNWYPIVSEKVQYDPKGQWKIPED
jgi:hypothetical protein